MTAAGKDEVVDDGGSGEGTREPTEEVMLEGGNGSSGVEDGGAGGGGTGSVVLGGSGGMTTAEVVMTGSGAVVDQPGGGGGGGGSGGRELGGGGGGGTTSGVVVTGHTVVLTGTVTVVTTVPPWAGQLGTAGGQPVMVCTRVVYMVLVQNLGGQVGFGQPSVGFPNECQSSSFSSPPQPTPWGEAAACAANAASSAAAEVFMVSFLCLVWDPTILVFL